MRREQKWLNGESDEEDDEDFKWIDKLNEQDERDNTYFTFINETREVMKSGTQAWNCYGNRTNAYLLVNYGFCFQNNLYDSFKFYVKLDLVFSKSKPITLISMLEPSISESCMQQIRIKRYQYNEILMAYLRSSLKEDFFDYQHNSSSKNVMVSEPMFHEFEKHCLFYYRGMLTLMLSNENKKSTLDADMDLLSD